MDQQSRQPVIAGNWKMYKTAAEAVDYIKELAPTVKGSNSRILLAVPFTAITASQEAAKDSGIVIGAQNMNDASEGAFTGEIAASMLLDAGAQFVLLGHSERRHLFNENNSFINKKVKRALAEKLQPILCIGESLDEREGGKTEEVLRKQLIECLSGVEGYQIEKIIIAYEPVWAIGTGESATSSMAEEAHLLCRRCLEEHWGGAAAATVPIIYGGSVKPSNAAELMACSNIDGLLVGGASLSAETFQSIVNYQKSTVV